jgi:hypothetical protein
MRIAQSLLARPHHLHHRRCHVDLSTGRQQSTGIGEHTDIDDADGAPPALRDASLYFHSPRTPARACVALLQLLLSRLLPRVDHSPHVDHSPAATMLASTVAMVAAAIGFGSLDTLAELASAAPATAAPATAALATAAHHHGRHRRPMRRPRRRHTQPRHGRHLRPRHRLPGHCRACHRRPPPQPPSPRPPPPPSPPPRPPPPLSPRQRRPRHRRPRRHCRPSPPPTTIASLETLVQWLHLMASLPAAVLAAGLG